jgi:hypothetical protein
MEFNMETCQMHLKLIANTRTSSNLKDYAEILDPNSNIMNLGILLGSVL